MVVMEQAASSTPSLPPDDQDAPIDAILLDDRPPVAPTRFDPAPMAAIGPALAPQWHQPGHKEKVYVVPKRFGVSGILGLTTGMALLFGFLRFLDAPPVVFLFLGSMALVICIVQMFWGAVPRKASMAAGASLWPFFSVAALIAGDAPWEGVLCSAVFSVPIGAALGYIVGTCVAGIFLVMERIDPYLPGGRERALKHEIAAATAAVK